MGRGARALHGQGAQQLAGLRGEQQHQASVHQARPAHNSTWCSAVSPSPSAGTFVRSITRLTCSGRVVLYMLACRVMLVCSRLRVMRVRNAYACHTLAPFASFGSIRASSILLRFGVPNDVGIPWLLKNKNDAAKKVAHLFIPMGSSKTVEQGAQGAGSKQPAAGKRGRGAFTDTPHSGHNWAQDMLQAIFYVVDLVPAALLNKTAVEQALLWCLMLALSGT